jgi:hypothetical protein
MSAFRSQKKRMRCEQGRSDASGVSMQQAGTRFWGHRSPGPHRTAGILARGDSAIKHKVKGGGEPMINLGSQGCERRKRPRAFAHPIPSTIRYASAEIQGAAVRDSAHVSRAASGGDVRDVNVPLQNHGRLPCSIQGRLVPKMRQRKGCYPH